MNLEEMYAVEWSQPQNAFHIQSVANMLQSNRMLFNRRVCVGYVPLAIFASYDEASDWCRKAMDARATGGPLHE